MPSAPTQPLRDSLTNLGADANGDAQVNTRVVSLLLLLLLVLVLLLLLVLVVVILRLKPPPKRDLRR